MEENKSKNNVKHAINKSISEINQSMIEHKECCPYCGTENIDVVSDPMSNGKLIAYFCNECNEYFVAPAFKIAKKPHQINIFNSKEERAKASGDETQRHLASLFAQIMNEHDFSHPDEGINFLLQHYEKTRNEIQPKKHRTSPGKMTIDDVEKYIKIRAYPNSPCGYQTTFANVTITYVKAFTDTVESIDTVTFACCSINNLKYQWLEFIEKKDLQEDCISAFSVDLTEYDKRYLGIIDSFVTQLLDLIYIDHEQSVKKKPTKEECDEIMNNILSSNYFDPFKRKIIYPHIVATKDPKTGITVRSVKRYWREE